MQFAPANAKPKIAKEYVLPTLTSELNNKHRKTNQNVKHYTQQRVYLIASSSLLTNIPAEYSIRFLFTKLVAKSRN